MSRATGGVSDARYGGWRRGLKAPWFRGTLAGVTEAFSPASAPAVYVRLDAPARLGLAKRFVAALVAGGALCVLVVAAWLNPSPNGYGTHMQLGLQPCGFLERTGYPCASCGMTTSFAWLVHGHPIQSFIEQPFGMILCVLTGVAFWSALYVAVTGKPSYRLINTIPTRVHLMIWLPLALAAWVWKIALVRGW